jgi:hypothetical protein
MIVLDDLNWKIEIPSISEWLARPLPQATFQHHQLLLKKYNEKFAGSQYNFSNQRKIFPTDRGNAVTRLRPRRIIKENSNVGSPAERNLIGAA